jgi:NAD(P)-dependent dehydrogenase (short-subunit alcohol dehydrogenase family)
MDLINASAIVTGGAGGFGAATVRRLVQKGAKVVIADISDERGEALARNVGAGETRALIRRADSLDAECSPGRETTARDLGPQKDRRSSLSPQWPSFFVRSERARCPR